MLYASIVFIINKNDTVLILKRSDDSLSFPGRWALPGGKAEPGESAKAVAVREVREETQIYLGEGDLNFLHKMVNGEKEFWFFWATVDSAFPVIDEEHQDWLWVGRDEVRKCCSIPTHPEVWRKFEAL